MRLLIIIIILNICSIKSIAQTVTDIELLRAKVVELTNTNRKILIRNDVLNNHKLAVYQSKLLIKTLSYEINLYIKTRGGNRAVSQIEKIVNATYLASWIFPDLGQDHIERMIVMNQWAFDESGYKDNLISSWKAGTYLPSIQKNVLRDSRDWGAFQINDIHAESVKNINFLYDSGIVNFKVNRVRTLKDVLEAKTNCVARCMIETDRKHRGWEWRHVRDRKFGKMISGVALKLERDGLYSRAFAEKYYYITPVRKYSSKNLSF